MQRLGERVIRKPWGRHDLPRPFRSAPEGEEPIGEIIFGDPEGVERDLLVKYLFTSEKLSIQVHPDDSAASAAGLPRGKDECWLVLDARPGAVIGLGLRKEVDRDQLRAAALDGSIEALVDWRPVRAGDFIYSPARTVHAIGPGLAVLEIQQNCDTTYRLYDYGRPRELHLDQGIAVAEPAPFAPVTEARALGAGREVMAEALFVVERWTGPLSAAIQPEPGRPVWAIPLGDGAACLDGTPLNSGSAWLVEEEAAVSLEEGAVLMVAYSGSSVLPTLLR